MSQDEQKQLEDLQQQLSSATARAAEIRNRWCQAIEDVRLYQGLLWGCLAFGVVTAIWLLLQR